MQFSGLDQHALRFNQEIRYKTNKELERNSFRWILDHSNQVSNLGDKLMIIKRKEKPSDFHCYQNSELAIGIINQLDKNKFYQLMENYLSDGELSFDVIDCCLGSGPLIGVDGAGL